MSSTASERKGSGEDTQDQLVVKLYYNRKNAHKLKLNTPTGQNQNPEMYFSRPLSISHPSLEQKTLLMMPDQYLACSYQQHASCRSPTPPAQKFWQPLARSIDKVDGGGKPSSNQWWMLQKQRLNDQKMAKLEQDNTNLKQSNADLKRSNVDSKRSNAKIHEKHRRVQASEGALRKQMADMESTKEKQNTDNINHMQDVKRSLKRKFEEWVDDAMQPPHRRLKDDPYAL
ncbi:hypothetical protein IWX49DRAFT_557642 [Phyllosticta citricarpa]